MKSRVLVADDSPTIQKVIDITLASEPCTLDQALTTEHLFEQLGTNKYNLILLDFCLSEEMSGFALAKKILQEAPGCTIIMMFGTFDSYEESDLDEAGIFDKIVKPFDGKKFITLCRKVFRQDIQESTDDVESSVKETPVETAPTEETPVDETPAEEESKPQESSETASNGESDSGAWIAEEAEEVAETTSDTPVEVAGISDGEDSIGSDWSMDAPEAPPVEENTEDDSSSDVAESPAETNDSDQLQQEVAGWGFSVPGMIDSDTPENTQIAGDIPGVIDSQNEDGPVAAPEGGQLWQVDNGDGEISTSHHESMDIESLTENMKAEIEEKVSAVVEEVVRKYCQETVERVAWEIIPDLAENLIKKELEAISDSLK